MTKDEITQLSLHEAEGEHVKTTIGTPGWSGVILPYLASMRREAAAKVIGLELGPLLQRNQEVCKVVDALINQINSIVTAGDSAHEALEADKNKDT